MVRAVTWHVMDSEAQFANAQRGSILEANGRLHHGVGGESSACQRQCPLVAVRMIRMAVRVDDVSHCERLGPGPLDEGLWRVRGIDEHRSPCFAIAEQVAEVAVAA